MGICESTNKKNNEKNLQNIFPNNMKFDSNYNLKVNPTNNDSKKINFIGTKYPRGEKIFYKKYDKGISKRNNPAIDNLYQEVELYISMNDVKNLNNYKIKVSICNNKKLNQFEFLGETE